MNQLLLLDRFDVFDIGYWILDIWYWILDIGYSVTFLMFGFEKFPGFATVQVFQFVSSLHFPLEPVSVLLTNPSDLVVREPIRVLLSNPSACCSRTVFCVSPQFADKSWIWFAYRLLRQFVVSTRVRLLKQTTRTVRLQYLACVFRRKLSCVLVRGTVYCITRWYSWCLRVVLEWLCVYSGSLYSSRLVLRNTNTQGSTKERLTSTSSVAILSMYGSNFNGSSCVFAHGQRGVLLNHVTCITNV